MPERPYSSLSDDEREAAGRLAAAVENSRREHDPRCAFHTEHPSRCDCKVWALIDGKGSQREVPDA